jgi:hypothetical protein
LRIPGRIAVYPAGRVTPDREDSERALFSRNAPIGADDAEEV